MRFDVFMAVNIWEVVFWVTTVCSLGNDFHTLTIRGSNSYLRDRNAPEDGGNNSLRNDVNHLREIGWDGVDWIELAQDRGQWKAPVNMVMNLRVP
jgi:hypothetical protein